MTNGSDVHGGKNVFFDEALAATGLGGDDESSSNARRTFIHVSRTTVEGD